MTDDKVPADGNLLEVEFPEDPSEAVTDDHETFGSGVESSPQPKASQRWVRILAYGVIPALCVVLAGGAGWLKWQSSAVNSNQLAGVQSIQTAKDTTIALLSYKPDTIQQDLTKAEGLLTGGFRDSYSKLIHDVVIPGATQQQISAVATIPAAAIVSATPQHAVVLVFVNQTTTIGSGAPSGSMSSVRVGLDRVDGKWLVSSFEPV